MKTCVKMCLLLNLSTILMAVGVATAATVAIPMPAPITMELEQGSGRGPAFIAVHEAKLLDFGNILRPVLK